MADIETLFVTKVYRAQLAGAAGKRLIEDLARACEAIAADDRAGQRWSAEHNYKGYTSYASLADLTWRSPEIAALKEHLDGHVATFAKDLDYDLGGRKLALNSIWINVLEPGGHHAAHIHPNSVISGTFYVAVPAGASAIRFEDPRHAMMMAAPARKAKASQENRAFVALQPKAGTVLLWESYLRHEVPLNGADSERVSISFNYS